MATGYLVVGGMSGLCTCVWRIPDHFKILTIAWALFERNYLNVK